MLKKKSHRSSYLPLGLWNDWIIIVKQDFSQKKEKNFSKVFQDSEIEMMNILPKSAHLFILAPARRISVSFYCSLFRDIFKVSLSYCDQKLMYLAINISL